MKNNITAAGRLIGSFFYIIWLPQLSQSSSRPPRVPAGLDLGQGRVLAGFWDLASSQVPRIAIRSAFWELAAADGRGDRGPRKRVKNGDSD